MDDFIKNVIEGYIDNEDTSIDSFFKIALVYQLGRIADALEEGIYTYEQNK